MFKNLYYFKKVGIFFTILFFILPTFFTILTAISEYYWEILNTSFSPFGGHWDMEFDVVLTIWFVFIFFFTILYGIPVNFIVHRIKKNASLKKKRLWDNFK